MKEKEEAVRKKISLVSEAKSACVETMPLEKMSVQALVELAAVEDVQAPLQFQQDNAVVEKIQEVETTTRVDTKPRARVSLQAAVEVAAEVVAPAEPVAQAEAADADFCKEAVLHGVDNPAKQFRAQRDSTPGVGSTIQTRLYSIYPCVCYGKAEFDNTHADSETFADTGPVADETNNQEAMGTCLGGQNKLGTNTCQVTPID